MNPSELDSSRVNAPGLQVEASSSRVSHTKTVFLATVVLALVAGSVALFAYSPKFSSAPLPATTVDQSSTLNSTITWSPNSLEVVLSPGESATRTFTVASSLKLTNVVIEPVSTIAPFLKVTPGTVPTVPANTAQNVQVTFSIPVNATLGTYAGTIHLRVGNKTLPQTLKAALYVWQPVMGSGYSFRIPPGLVETTQGDGSDERFFSKSGDNGYRLEFRHYAKAPDLQLSQWIASEWIGLPAGSLLSGYDRIASGAANVSVLNLNTSNTATILTERDAGDAIQVFIETMDHTIVYVLAASGQDFNQTINLQSSVPELVSMVKTFDIH